MPQWEYCTLSCTNDTIYYTLYQEQGEYEDSRAYTDDLWASCIAVLGALRWEAITTTILTSPQEMVQIWQFKRPIQPGNNVFVFQ